MKNAVIIVETVVISLVAGVVASAVLLWRGGFVDFRGCDKCAVQQPQQPMQQAPAPDATLGDIVGSPFEARAAETNSTTVGRLKLSDELYTKGQADARFATLDVMDAISDSIGQVPDDGYADGAGWSVELTQSGVYDPERPGLPWTGYRILVRKNDGTKVEPELEVTSRDGGARYARSFFMEVMSARDGQPVAQQSGNEIVPTFSGAGIVDVKVTYDGSYKTVSLGVHPLYPFDQGVDEVSALSAGLRNMKLERARRAGVKVD